MRARVGTETVLTSRGLTNSIELWEVVVMLNEAGVRVLLPVGVSFVGKSYWDLRVSVGRWCEGL